MSFPKKIPTAMRRIGIAVDFIPTARPLIMFVADPVSESVLYRALN